MWSKEVIPITNIDIAQNDEKGLFPSLCEYSWLLLLVTFGGKTGSDKQTEYQTEEGMVIIDIDSRHRFVNKAV